MSEETNVQQEQTPKKSCTLVVITAVLALLLSIASLATSIYTLANGGGSSDGKKVVISKQYDKGQSIEKAIATEKPMIVFFYTDWCGFCQRFVPTFHKVAKSKEIRKNFAIAYVNCEVEKNRKHMQEYNVQGFPTVYVVDGEKRTHLENNTFFNEDSVDVIKADALKAIGK